MEVTQRTSIRRRIGVQDRNNREERQNAAPRKPRICEQQPLNTRTIVYYVKMSNDPNPKITVKPPHEIRVINEDNIETCLNDVDCSWNHLVFGSLGTCQLLNKRLLELATTYDNHYLRNVSVLHDTNDLTKVVFQPRNKNGYPIFRRVVNFVRSKTDIESTRIIERIWDNGRLISPDISELTQVVNARVLDSGYGHMRELMENKVPIGTRLQQGQRVVAFWNRNLISHAQGKQGTRKINGKSNGTVDVSTTWWYDWYASRPPCLSGKLMQFTGTCGYNSALNAILLSSRTGPLVWKLLHEKIDHETRKTLRGLPLDTCPSNLIHMMYMLLNAIYRDRVEINQGTFINRLAVLLVRQDALLDDRTVRINKYAYKTDNVLEDGVYPSQVARTVLTTIFDEKVYVESESEHGAITNSNTQILHLRTNHANIELDIEIEINRVKYMLDWCVFILVMGDNSSHAVSVIFCDGESYLYDSTHNHIARLDDVTCETVKQASSKHWKSTHAVWNVACYVRQDATMSNVLTLRSNMIKRDFKRDFVSKPTIQHTQRMKRKNELDSEYNEWTKNANAARSAARRIQTLIDRKIQERLKQEEDQQARLLAAKQARLLAAQRVKLARSLAIQERLKQEEDQQARSLAAKEARSLAAKEARSLAAERVKLAAYPYRLAAYPYRLAAQKGDHTGPKVKR
jgi:hypothetical protein